MLLTTTIGNKFAEMGARLRVRPFPENPFRRDGNRIIQIDVLKDKSGEYFDLQTKGDGVSLQVIDVQKKDRHLLLKVKSLDPKSKDPAFTFLCGHDERHWFTCAVPENAKATKVSEAKQALKPQEVIALERREGIRAKNLHKRHRKLGSGKKIHRQGEFMFLPEPDFKPDIEIAVLKKEPLQRGRSKPHMAEFLYRTGGTKVYVNSSHPNGLTEREYQSFVKSSPQTRGNWRVMVRDARAYVKGRIRHPDHATVDLGDTWHRVAINTEGQSRAAEQVAFLD